MQRDAASKKAKEGQKGKKSSPGYKKNATAQTPAKKKVRGRGQLLMVGGKQSEVGYQKP